MSVTTSLVEAGAPRITPSAAGPGLNIGELLTRREHEVVALLTEGMTAVAIAHRLGVSHRTVEKHLENVYHKVGVRDRLSAVLVLYLAAQRASM